MPPKDSLARYRRWYRQLLRLYPRAFRERFAEGMEQTFHDLCRERASAGQSLFGFALRTFFETSAGIVKENSSHFITQHKNICRIAIGTGLVLLIPLVAMLVSDEWNWDPFDFLFMGALLFGTGLTYELVAPRGGTFAYRAAVAIACATGLFIIWVNAAVGIIGDEELANAMFFGVIVMGFLGACRARFHPRGMARTLLWTAAAQTLVPLIALTWVPEADFAPGVVPVMRLNMVFAVLWIISALLFRCSATPPAKSPQIEPAPSP